MKMYNLTPNDSHKSFYGKAKVEVGDNGEETLYSYNTPIVRRKADGTMAKLYNYEPSATTLRHIRTFCGLDKKQFMAL